MSFGDRPSLTVGQTVGCVVYVVIGGAIAVFFMLAAAMGDCPSETDCMSETGRALLFYGVPLAIFAGGLALVWLFMRGGKD